MGKYYTIELEDNTGSRKGLLRVEGILAYDKLKRALEGPETSIANVYEVALVLNKSFDFYMIDKGLENDKKTDLHQVRNIKAID